MKNRLIVVFGSMLVASISAFGALAQTSEHAVWRPQVGAMDSVSPLTQLVQQDRDRMPRGPRRDRDDDEDLDFGRGDWRPGMMREGMGAGPGVMRPGMMAHALGGARIHLRRGDSAVNVRCPEDVRLNECIDAVGRLLDRLSTMGTGGGTSSGPATTPPR